ncbi:Tudor/PWWP/MBT superfamily protein [Rhynchospora pubera]|uniref:Tudor/PWWP/MBT superfamily protein n=1 Tax=Rhynchospora pubera TaxID=906938 RepID=A0AAV8HZK5_9POAL|nr:Tudor/PWWP/MBT superfamily protein [Rhynchospora pubera]
MSSCDEKGDASMADDDWTPIEDRSPGTLVWVRRRNGSWWPGRILPKEEVPSKLRKPQRSGVPIKLLGREDGNIDYYNLDKSRRVKLFRCGEYDDCIEKAKLHGSQKHAKKYPNQGKYVRREDAILHALEIERSAVRLAAAGPSTSSSRPKQINGLKKKPSCSTHKKAAGGRHLASKKKVKNPNDSEEDVKTEGMLRMRDLTDIGSEVLPSKKKSESQELALVKPNLVNGMNFQLGGVGSFGMSTSNSLTTKKKRSNMAQAYENMRKKQKSVPLSEICDGTRVIIPSYCDWVGPKVSNKCYLMDSGMNNKGPDSSETSSHSTCNGRDLESGGALGAVVEHASSDGFFNVPLVMGDFYEGDLAPFSSCTSDKAGMFMLECKTTNSNQETSNSQHNHLPAAGILGRRKQSHEDSDAADAPFPESTESESNKSMDAKLDLHSDSDDTIAEMEVTNSGCNNDMLSLVDSPVSDVQYETVKPLKSISMEPTLYDVEMQVEASYKGPRVPLVSLMSKLNGKAIVGHPISVKVLKDGSTLSLISRREHHRPSTSSISQLLKRDEKVSSGQRKGASHKSSKSWKKMVAGNSSNSNSTNKKVGFSPRKMRRLSSITIDHKERGERKLLVEKVGGPRVACVPLRLVFSRINEALKFSSRLENP